MILLPSLLYLILGGGARLRRPSRERTLNTLSVLILVEELHACNGARHAGAEFVPHDLAVDSARDAVVELQVHLGDGVVREDRGVGDITCTGGVWLASCSSSFLQLSRSCRPNLGSVFSIHRGRTDGSGLNHVADGEALDRLVLGDATSAVGAADRLDVAAAVLVATAAVNG